jgi:putative peptidoglycan lipid II flippase
MKLVPRMPRLTPDVKRVITLSVPGIISGGIMQINLVIATMIATTIEGGVAFLYYADRLYQLPLGVIGVAIGVVLLPDMSRKLRAGNEAGALQSQNRALELSLFLTIPSAFALMAIAMPIIRTVYEHGAFTRADTAAVAPAVLCFAAGLPAFSITKVFQPGFYAREDTRTPMRFAIVSVVINIVASLLLSRVMGHVGIALATSLAAWANAGLLAVTLSRRGLFALDERSRKRLPRIVLSGLLMGGLLLAGSWLLRGNYAEHAGFIAAAWGLTLLVAGGALVYFALAHLTGAMRLGELKSMLKR